MSNVEGLFCYQEGQCVCGNDCLEVVVTTTVVEVTSFKTTHKGNPQEVVARLQAIQWVVEEELPDRTTLVHDLIPGARRIVLHT